ncbi:hypothetical protein [Arthrobacter cavernae]|uniref:Uncharacterized protein n=1 Tax=Arthrobacter cavernae TaxID=2817681 RepID=A0A939HET4_9MICC|nr:hypothetical protein [Arthrobacter cavernae]MBO1267070.1 hypothetical protein [Arthrobacter cavernae]
MSNPKKLTKIKFFSINRDIRDGRRSNAQMAAFHNVSIETIRTVRNAKTWNGFLAHKQAKAARALKRKIELGKARAAQIKRPSDIPDIAVADPDMTASQTWTRPSLQEQIDVLADEVANLKRQRGPFRFSIIKKDNK